VVVLPYCQYCGKELATDANFCLNCGKPIGPQGVTSSSGPVKYAQSEKATKLPHTRAKTAVAGFFILMGLITIFAALEQYFVSVGTIIEEMSWEISSRYFLFGFICLIIGCLIGLYKPK